MVAFSKAFGYRFYDRDLNEDLTKVKRTLPDGKEHDIITKTLYTIEFTSSRKCMSIIVEITDINREKNSYWV